MAGAVVEALAGLSAEDMALALHGVPDRALCALDRDWAQWAHDGQREPAGDWRVWVMMAGRGFGKTRAGAEWVCGLAEAEPDLRIALVAATVDEARRIMVEGPSGLIAVARQRVRFEPSLKRVRFESGAEAFLYSGASPASLRGPEHHVAWCDELAKWNKPEESWDMLQLGLRLGERPRVLVTTTPRAGAGLDRILREAVVTGGHTRANPHLSPAYVAAVEGLYGGTRLGRQELDGVLERDVEGALWTAALIERALRDEASPSSASPQDERFVRVVIGVDPPASAAGTCGIVACGVDEAGIGHVIADCSVAGLSPEGWARAVAEAARTHGADRVVAEANQGGAMVESVLAAADAALPVRLVRATRGKTVRAEPVAALFERGKAWFCGRFPELEAELRGMVAGGGYRGPGESPDRADAMVWALWALMIAGGAGPRVRGF